MAAQNQKIFYRKIVLLARCPAAPPAGIFFLWFAVLFCAGCHRDEVSVYRVPKNSESLRPMAQSESPANPGAPGSWQIKYVAPPGWQEEPPAGLSLARFSLDGHKAELSVMTFPGAGASQLDLINIVRETSGLPPLNSEQLAKLVEPVAIGDETGSLIDLTGSVSAGTNAAPASVIVAVLPHGGATWFYKMIGEPDTVAAQKPALRQFLKSISYISGAVAPRDNQVTGSDSMSAPPGTPPLATGSAPKPAWEIPAGWREVPPTQMLLAKFDLSGVDGQAAVTVSEFPGEVGGPLLNVNRWRNSVGLTPLTENELGAATRSLDVPGGKAMLVDVNGKNPKNGKETRLIGVIWPRTGETWFYKLMGDAAPAAREREAFLKFLQSVRYPNA